MNRFPPSSSLSAPPVRKSVPKASDFSFSNVGLSPAAADAIWNALRRALVEIQAGNNSKLRFEELYRNAYTLVLHKQGDKLYRGVEEVIEQRMRQSAAEVAQASDAFLLERLVAAWDDHKLKMSMMRDILMYMDKTHCKALCLPPVYERGICMFRDYVVKAHGILPRMTDIMLDWVRRDRQGEVVDSTLLKHSCTLLMEANLNQPDLYVREFERDLLQQTRDFYSVESQAFLAGNTVADYLRKAESRLMEEEARAARFLEPATHPKLKSLLHDELLVRHAKRLVDDASTGATALLRAGAVEDCARMYALFSRVPSCLEPLRDAFGALVKSTACALVGDAENARTPRLFVERVLDCRAHFLRFVERAFRHDRAFARVLKDGLEYALNLDTRAAQFLSLYIDDLLRRHNGGHGHAASSSSAEGAGAGWSEAELDAKLDECMALYRHLQDRDMFEEYYKSALSKRLLDHSGQAASSDAERSMIAKLKAESGHQMTSRLEGMFRDIELSRQTMQTWREDYPQPAGCELSVSVLTTGFWPLPPVPQCVLPPEAQSATESFKQYYLSKHNGRKLTWQTSLGQAELRCQFDSGRKELVVSTYQMCLLMLFNSRDVWSFAEMEAATRIPTAELTRHLLSLAHPQVKVLLKNPPGKACAPDHRFKYNTKYVSKLYRNKIQLLSKAAIGGSEQQTGAEGGWGDAAAASAAASSSSGGSVPAAVLESRKFSIEASIVRIMKSRKREEHSALIAEVNKQLQHKFPVEPQVVKKRIEALIEREYLERDPNNRRIYLYKA